MVSFDTLYKEYAETKNGDVNAFCEKYAENSLATRFLLIRSFNTENLKLLLSNNDIKYSSKKEYDLMKTVYDSVISIDDLLSYIEDKRAELIEAREKEVEGLQEVLREIPVVQCGVRNDNVNTIVQAFTRNKELKTFDALIESLNTNIFSRVKQYCLWSYYNQTSNDIIELFFLRHKNVIPTLRKIYNIDFFLRINDKLVPFDLKITHVSDKYFELASRGIIPSTAGHDDYVVNTGNKSELEMIKEYYKAFKSQHKELSLPNLKDFSSDTKASLAGFLVNINPESEKFIIEMQTNHENYVPSNQEKLKMLEWWNYKYQEDRLFCNNNRLFVFLAYKTKFTDGRDLKGNITEIGELVKDLLDNISEDSLHMINYHYDKSTKLKGDYTAFSLSTIYAK